jgi:hypothetical protein
MRFVLGDDASADRSLLEIPEINEPHDSRMASAQSNCKLTEILVERNDYLAVLRGMGEDLSIARIDRPFSNPLYFVSGPFELLLCAWPDAAIEQELQAASSVMAGSMRS